MNYADFRNQQESFLSSDGSIKYRDKGRGPVILLLHGVPSSSWLYRDFIDPISAAGYRVIAPDMLGFGNSESPSGYELYSGEAHARRLLELMDHLAIEQWTHVLHDAGGLWTWELVKQAPKRIAKLMLFNCILLETGFQPPVRMEPGLMAKFSLWLYRRSATVGIILGSLFKKGLQHKKLSWREFEGYKRPLLEGKTAALYYFFTQTCLNLPDYRTVLKDINIPLRLIWGKNDPMLAWENQPMEV